MTLDRPHITVQNTCPLCSRPSYVIVFKDEFEAWLEDIQTGGPRRHIQVAMPEMSPENREILITGTHPECWDAMFKDEEES